MDSFSEWLEGEPTAGNLREHGDYCAHEAYGWTEEIHQGQKPSLLRPETAAVYAAIAIYCEIRRLADLMPSSDDLREHTKALNLHSRVMGDHIQAMKRFGGR